MRNETKVELSRIFILKQLDKLQRATGKSSDELQGLIRRLQDQLQLLDNYRESLYYNDQLVEVIKKNLSDA